MLYQILKHGMVSSGLRCRMVRADYRRYTMITLGCVTLFIFICRFVIFTFRESPKFLLAKGHDAHALDVLYSIAKFNRVAQPKLTMDDFNALDYEDRSKQSRLSSDSDSDADSRTGMMGNASASNVITHFFQMTFGHLKKLFADKTYAYVFVVLAIAYVPSLVKNSRADV
jgi:hypothetical protein